MAASVSEVAVLAFHIADGCAKILVPMLCFLGGSSPRSPAADKAAVALLVLPMAFVAGHIVAHFAGVLLACLHLAVVPAPAVVSSVDPVAVRFAVLLFALVSAWLLLIAAPFVAFFFLPQLR